MGYDLVTTATLFFISCILLCRLLQIWQRTYVRVFIASVVKPQGTLKEAHSELFLILNNSMSKREQFYRCSNKEFQISLTFNPNIQYLLNNGLDYCFQEIPCLNL